MKVSHHLVLLFFRKLRLFLREEEVQKILPESLFVKGRDGYPAAFGNAADQVFYGLVGLLTASSEAHHERAHDRHVHVCLAADVIEPVREPDKFIDLFQHAEGHGAHGFHEDLANVGLGQEL